MFSLKSINSNIKQWDSFVESVNLKQNEIKMLETKDIQSLSKDIQSQFKESTEQKQLFVSAFAIFKEAVRRFKQIDLFDVQIQGAIALCDNKIAEMKTGEGKTLTAGMAAYALALSGRKVHVITTNDYLANRDLDELRPLFTFLGVSTGLVLNSFNIAERMISYSSQIVYTTNKEIGFDYLKDNLKKNPEELIHSSLDFAIIDEADSILIDEANTPLVISGENHEVTEKMIDLYHFIEKLDESLFEIDYRKKRIALLDSTISEFENFLSDWEIFYPKDLYDPNNNEILHMVYQCLKARFFFHKDKEYIVRDEDILLVDKNTGRISSDRKYSNSLHQALEIKERLKPSPEQISLASICYQNLFNLYNGISGMSGTAVSESDELKDIYNIEAISIPTNKPIIRKDHNDILCKNIEDKEDCIIEEIILRYRNRQPVLVGTPDIFVSERISLKLIQKDIPHVLLNAKNHEKEAEIISQAGRLGSITIATNMAGRGTDILLGGNPLTIFDLEENDEKDLQRTMSQCRIEKQKVKEIGGLCVIGWSRNESKRVDDQLIGRAGRQGDPGESVFFLSLEDDIFINVDPSVKEVIKQKIQNKKSIPVNKKIFRLVMNSQEQVESDYSAQRKELFKYDNVLEDQRKIIYNNRLEILRSDDLTHIIYSLMHDAVFETLSYYIPDKTPNYQWRDEQVQELCYMNWNLIYSETQLILEKDITATDAKEEIFNLIWLEAHKKLLDVGSSFKTKNLCRNIILSVLDEYWSVHIRLLETLRQSINLSTYASINPFIEYQKTSFQLYHVMLRRIKLEVSRNIINL
jgi:preprotein translocase subunit SecA